jgi:hypothetical protein
MRSLSPNPKRDAQREAAFSQERLSQLRGLLILGAVVLLVILYRAYTRGDLHAGWWRI